MTMRSRFTDEAAPCGRRVDGERVVDDDGEGYVFEHLTWDCGCQRTRRQFHDGSVQHRVVDHHGHVQSDEHSSLHEG